MAPQPDRICSVCDRTYPGGALVTCPVDGAPLIVSALDDIDPMIGRDIGGRYRVTRLLGKGGMGAVYHARQSVINRAVAVKVLRANPDDPQGAAKRFVREARLAASLAHPNIVTIHDFGQEADGTLYVVMEFLEGQSLSALLDNGPLSPARAARIGAEICDALAHAHAKDIIHRDIKPENIVVTRADPTGDRLKVVDFGLARSLGDASTHITATGIVFGTAAYISPEVAVGRQAGPGADLYALGVMLHEMVEWRLPFPEDNPNALLIAHASKAPTPMSPAVPATFREIVAALLEKDPDVRPISAAELREALLLAASEPGADVVIASTAGISPSGMAEPANLQRGEPTGVALDPGGGTGPMTGHGTGVRRATLPTRSSGTPGVRAQSAAASPGGRRWLPMAFGAGVIGAATAAFVTLAQGPDGRPGPVAHDRASANTAPSAPHALPTDPAAAAPPPHTRSTAPTVLKAPAPVTPSASEHPPAAPAPSERPAETSLAWEFDANVIAEVSLDEDPSEGRTQRRWTTLGKTPLDANLKVTEGSRTFRFRSPGYKDTLVTRPETGDRRVRIQLARISAAPTRATAPPASASPRTRPEAPAREKFLDDE